MRQYLRKIYKVLFRNRLLLPLVEARPHNIFAYLRFLKDYVAYRKKLPPKEPLSVWPRLGEKAASVDFHYFYQGVWAAQKIQATKPIEHVDVGSQVDLIGFLTTITRVTFVDLRPLPVQLDGLTNIQGTILDLPFPDNSVKSLSCLHVAEHIGLGRYGDHLDPEGTIKACRELSRVLAKNGNLYFSLPIGKKHTFFNAHRVHEPQTILSYFPSLKLAEFSAINDRGQFITHAQMEKLENEKYACGLFHFTKE